MRNKIFWIALAIVIIIVSGYALSRNSAEYNKEATETKEGVMMQKNEIVKKDGDAMVKEDSKITRGGQKMTKGTYVEYSPAALAEASKNGGKAILFFYAPWCPFCKVADAAFTSRTGDIPAGVTVLKTSYDNEKELKTKYGVTYQHTFVQIDAQGNQITKWNGGDIDSLKTNLK
ncbi:MAG: thioredoxin family protein [Patescibacteria group bacterium]